MRQFKPLTPSEFPLMVETADNLKVRFSTASQLLEDIEACQEYYDDIYEGAQIGEHGDCQEDAHKLAELTLGLLRLENILTAPNEGEEDTDYAYLVYEKDFCSNPCCICTHNCYSMGER